MKLALSETPKTGFLATNVFHFFSRKPWNYPVYSFMVAKKIHFFTKLFFCAGSCGCVILFEKKMCKRQIAIKERPLIAVVFLI